MAIPPLPPFTWLFLLALGVVAVERLVELRVSARHAAALLARGGRVVRDDGYGLIVAVHVAWFPALLAEWFLAPWAGPHVLTVPLLALFVLAQGLRYWSAATLGERYTTKVIVLPRAPLVASGPYKWLRHPIYVAVAVEVVAFPLAFGLFGGALVLGALNLVALARRIRREAEAIAASAHSRGARVRDASG